MVRNRFAVLLVFLLVASAAFAQSNDVAVSFGATLSPGAEGSAICEAILICPTGFVDRPLNLDFRLRAPMLTGWQTSE